MNVWKQHNRGPDILAGSENVKTSEDVLADASKQVRVFCLLSGYRLTLGVSTGRRGRMTSSYHWHKLQTLEDLIHQMFTISRLCFTHGQDQRKSSPPKTFLQTF